MSETEDIGDMLRGMAPSEEYKHQAVFESLKNLWIPNYLIF
jgi:hypothetical protein